MVTQFIGNVFSNVEVGHIFVISGKSLDRAQRLDVSLRCGKPDGSNVPLHMSVRFLENIIVRNSEIKRAWGREERTDNLYPKSVPNPLKSGGTFKIYLLLGHDRFHISINDQPYCTFVYRIPVNEIKAIAVNKDLESIRQIDHRSVFPSPYPRLAAEPNKLDFSNDVPRRYKPGHIIVITGTPLGDPRGQFTLRFFEGSTKKQALHFNPRFLPDNVVVRNAHADNLTFPPNLEERTGGFPFVINQQFKIAIGLTDIEFKFAINGKFFSTFRYRITNLLNSLGGLKLQGDNGVRLQITSVDHITGGVSDCRGFESFSVKRSSGNSCRCM